MAPFACARSVGPGVCGHGCRHQAVSDPATNMRAPSSGSRQSSPAGSSRHPDCGPLVQARAARSCPPAVRRSGYPAIPRSVLVGCRGPGELLPCEQSRLSQFLPSPLRRSAAGTRFSPLGRWAAGPLGRWAAGPLGRWAAGPLGRWAAGPLGRWAAGPLGRWAAGPLGRWAAGPLGRWAAGPLGRWAAGPLGRWAAGPLGRWAAGPLGRWAAGPLGRWAAGPLGRVIPCGMFHVKHEGLIDSTSVCQRCFT
ncbi:hypothetical protein IW245_005821 [Longispora fulva]|uniref:Uncharacterized protein n=1 Tax=Longispora fulva TaxID=619741 RepID=A0A8J7GMC1_9ACTN|nr:hypothetical protein [Longispora fulva]